MFKKIAIVGLGLIGGSFALALKQRGFTGTVTGWDRQEVLEQALNREAVDENPASLQEALTGTDLVVLAVPLQEIPGVARQVCSCLEPGAVLTDVASTKTWVKKQIQPHLPPSCSYIGGHPMAGSDRSGFSAADPYLLENAMYLLVREEDTGRGSMRQLKRLISFLGADPVEITAEEHDHLVALISHLPHLTAAALVNLLAGDDHREMLYKLAAGGFRDTTRVASGDASLWRGILSTNREAVLEAIELLNRQLEEIKDKLKQPQFNGVEEFLQSARQERAKIPFSRGMQTDNFPITVLAPDRPGIIGQLATILGDAGVNIADLQVLRVREEEGGSLSLSFRSLPEQEKSLTLLNSRGFKAWAND